MEDGKKMIKIIYEDNHLLVVEKPINMPTQADSTNDEDLLTQLKLYLKEKYQKPGNVYLGLVHRLDRPVGGVMVFAKTSKAASRLSEQIRTNKMQKVYYAVLDGVMKNTKGILKDKLLKNRENNITTVNVKGKEAELYYEVCDIKDKLSLVKINLKTGRSHQIRVQFASRGCPLYGDQKYNLKAIKAPIALYAYQLSFYHPITKELLNFSGTIPDRHPFNIFNNYNF